MQLTERQRIEFLEGAVEVSVGQFLTRTKDYASRYFGPFLGFFWITVGIQFFIALILGAFGAFIPFFNFVLQLVVTPFTNMLLCGVYVYLHEAEQGKPLFDNFFAVLSKNSSSFLQFMLLLLINFAVYLICMLPGIVLLVINVFAGDFNFDSILNDPDEFLILLTTYLPGLLLVGLGLLFAGLYSLFTLYAIPLIGFYELAVMDALRISFARVRKTFVAHLLLYLIFTVASVLLATVFVLSGVFGIILAVFFGLTMLVIGGPLLYGLLTGTFFSVFPVPSADETAALEDTDGFLTGREDILDDL